MYPRPLTFSSSFIEFICFKEFLRLIVRNKRYLPIIIAMYARTIYSLKDSRIMRCAYCLARYIDDLADGDRRVNNSVGHAIKKIYMILNGSTMRLKTPFEYLAGYLYAMIRENYKESQKVLKLFRNLIEALEYDYRRRQNSILLSESELFHHIYQIQYNALKITAIIVRGNPEEMPLEQLAKAQTFLYTVRDHLEDISNHIFNLPKEILLAPVKEDHLRLSDLLQSPEYQEWIEDWFQKGQLFLEDAFQESKMISSHRSRMVVLPIIRGLRWTCRWKSFHIKRKEKDVVIQVVP